MIGSTLGHFAVTAKLGEGGMGEVWRATDTRLGREVAIKLLPDDFAVDPDRHARFEREAKLLAALNHPNIAILYGLEHLPDRHALVMELVPGVGLGERLAEGPLAVDEAVAIALQIARGLEAAHEQGIIHRDLKPANVRVRPDGVVKVLDFGLAKAWHSAGEGRDMEMSPTVTHLPTAAGLILGTAAYMAPEQARGRAVDRRADVWAFGVVLWEMLTGRRLFTGETLTDVIAAVVTFEPDWSALPAGTPLGLRRLLERCLRRDPRQRMPDIGACRLELEELGSLSAAAAATAPPAPSRPRRPALVAVALAVAAAAALVGAAVGGYRLALGRVERPRVAFTVPPPDGTAGFFLHPERPGPVAVSPDGRMLAFTANDEQGFRLYLRPLAATRAVAVPGTEGAQYPFWSPDSTEVGYFAGGAIRRVTVAGAANLPVTVCAAAEMKGASWGRSDVIVFAPDAGSGLMKVAAGGGEPSPVTVLDAARGEDSHRHPRFLPDGRRFLYLARVRGGGADSVVAVGSLDGDLAVDVMRSATAAEYAAGRLLFVREGKLLAQPFDPDRLALSGFPTGLAEDLRVVASGTAAAVFSAASGGEVVAYQQESTAGEYRLVWRDRSGGDLGSLGDLAAYYDVRLSPDGSSAAVTVGTAAAGKADVWVYDVARNLRTRATFDESDEWGAAWRRDGHSFAFACDRHGTYDLFEIALGGAEAERELLRSETVLLPTGFSPDGRLLLVNEQGARVALGSWNVAVLDLASGGTTPLVASPADEGIASFSPDGRWIAYHSTESGTFEVYIAPFPGPGRKWQVSNGGGLWPEWRGDGREIFYRSTSAVHAVAVDTSGPRVVIGEPERLFALDTNESANYRFSAAPDGQRFLVIEPAAGMQARPLVVEVGWPERLAAVGGGRG